MTIELSVVVVNWNTRDLLADCLASVYAGVGDLSVEVIVLDNASTDASATMVRERFPWVRLIENRENLGFAGGNNAALREARGDILLLLNPDTVIVADALQRLRACLVDVSSLAAVAPQLLYPDGAPQNSWGKFPSLRGELSWLRERTNSAQEFATKSYPLLNVDWAKGACLMIRRAAWEQVGELDEEYWLYTEEADWCYRARRLGWTIAVRPDACIVHIEQAASRQNVARSLIQYHRSRALFLRKHVSPLAARTLWGICALKATLYVLAPDRSPLGRGRNELEIADVRQAYRGLMSESLRRILALSPTSRTQP